MADKIYECRFSIGLHGTTPNDQTNINFLIRTAMDRGAAGFTSLANAQGAAIRAILCTPVTLIGVVYAPRNRPGSPQPDTGSHMPKYLGLAGQRTTATSAKLAIDETVAKFGKTADFGNAGIQKIRGCYFVDEIDSTGGGRPATKSPFTVTPFNAFGAAMIAACTANAATLVLPAPRKENWISGARPVTAMPYAGIGALQLDKNNKSVEETEDDVIRRTLKAIERKYLKASRDADGNAIAVVGAILDALANTLLRLITAYGWNRILQFALPANVRTYVVPALPA